MSAGRRLAVLAVLTTALTLASVAVPVPMAWSAPSVRFAEVAARRAVRVAVPFGRVTVPLSSTVPVPFGASHLGVRWVGSEDAVVEVRTATSPARWGPWQPVEVAHDLGHEARREVLSGLLRVQGATLVQSRATGDANDVRLVAIDAENGPRHLVRAKRAARAQVAQPAVVTRAAWGADERQRRPTPPIHAPLTRMVVHHTVTPNGDPDPAATMRAMYAYHVKANGWDDLGYNFVVDAAGRVYEGRWARAYGAGEAPTGALPDGRGVVGAHAEGQNVGSVGVAVMGTFTGGPPTAAAIDALQRVLAWNADEHGIDPTATAVWNGGHVLPAIAGHRDVGSTACPGDRLYELLPGIRRAVAAQVAQARRVATRGYWVLRGDGSVSAHGQAPAVAPLLGPLLLGGAVGIAATPSGRGFWVLTAGGRVLPAGDAALLLSPELSLLQPVGRGVAIESTASGLGYWVLEESGRVRPFGDAPELGSPPAGPAVDLVRTAGGRGYWVLGADGKVSAHGDARHHGDGSGVQRPAVALIPSPGGNGYRVVGADGGVAVFGQARVLGGLPERGQARRVVDAHPSASGRGYYLLAEDGAVFTFGDAVPHGNAPGGPAVALAAVS